MKIEVLKLNLTNEMDIVLAHRRATQIAKFAGISLSEQTRFATAVSEICRNTIEYAREGTITFNVYSDAQNSIEAEVHDKGKGITGLDKILQRDPFTYKGRGLGIIFARRLSDEFQIRSGNTGTFVSIRKNSPKKKNPLSKLIVEGWKKHIQDEPMLSAYEELKIRNAQLLELTEELTGQKEQIEALMERLRQSNRNMQDFTFAIAHDLKTPLTSLKLSLEMLPPREQENRFLDVIHRSVNRLDKTIHGLIDILFIQDTEKQVIRELRFSQLLQEVEEDHRDSIRKLGVKIERNFTKGESLSYPEGYAKSIFTNLVSNSIKYKADRPLVIQVDTESTRKGIRLTYRDNGTGIDLAKHGVSLFKPFRRLTLSGEGRGIGLYMIKTMVENNGGSVEVQSEPGQGTTFVFHLVKFT